MKEQVKDYHSIWLYFDKIPTEWYNKIEKVILIDGTITKCRSSITQRCFNYPSTDELLEIMQGEFIDQNEGIVRTLKLEFDRDNKNWIAAYYRDDGYGAVDYLKVGATMHDALIRLLLHVLRKGYVFEGSGQADYINSLEKVDS